MDKKNFYKCIKNALVKIVIYPLAIWYLKIKPFPLLLRLYFASIRWKLRWKIRSFKNINWIRKIRSWYQRKKRQIKYKKDLKKFNGNKEALNTYYYQEFSKNWEEILEKIKKLEGNYDI